MDYEVPKRLALGLALSFALHRLAQQSSHPVEEVDHVEKEIIRMLRDATPPKPMTKARRVVCFVSGLAFVVTTLFLLMLADQGSRMGMMLGAACMTAFAAIVMLGSALFPNFTLAREHLDRRRQR